MATTVTYAVSIRLPSGQYVSVNIGAISDDAASR